jgi:hypothetical protein
MELKDLVSKACWSSRSEFPPSRPLCDRIFACGEGIYLLTNPRFRDGDPVYAIGWAQSDYWARRSWEVPFSGELSPSPAVWDGVPSLDFLGRPGVLLFAALLDFERKQPDAKVTLLYGCYRFADGAFLYTAISGTGGITFIYSSNEPDATDEPVAIQLRLPDRE